MLVGLKKYSADVWVDVGQSIAHLYQIKWGYRSGMIADVKSYENEGKK